MSFLFEKLDVYQISVALAAEISKMTEAFPKRTYYLADQLNRAALSIVANISEGNSPFSKGGNLTKSERLLGVSP